MSPPITTTFPAASVQMTTVLVLQVFSKRLVFWRVDYPAMMITDTSEFRHGGYHCREFEDSIEHLVSEFTANIIRGTVAAVATSLGMHSAN